MLHHVWSTKKDMQTSFCVAVVQRFGWGTTAEVSVTKVIIRASCMLAATDGGNSLMIHNMKAEGIDEPGNNMIFITSLWR